MVSMGRGAAYLTFEPQSAERWLMAGDHQTGHTSVHLERGLCLYKNTAYIPNPSVYRRNC